jgi:hypothetical protein
MSVPTAAAHIRFLLGNLNGFDPHRHAPRAICWRWIAGRSTGRALQDEVMCLSRLPVSLIYRRCCFCMVDQAASVGRLDHLMRADNMRSAHYHR